MQLVFLIILIPILCRKRGTWSFISNHGGTRLSGFQCIGLDRFDLVQSKMNDVALMPIMEIDYQ